MFICILHNLESIVNEDVNIDPFSMDDASHYVYTYGYSYNRKSIMSTNDGHKMHDHQ